MIKGKYYKRTDSWLKFFALVIGISLIIAIPLSATVLYASAQSDAYGETYYAALKTKYDRITSLEEPKVVVIGGSSVAFGIDSKIAEAELHMPVVNFGLYAAFGLQCMLDLSVDSLGAGDIVVIAPEFSSQMYSDFVGYEYLLQACEGRLDMIGVLGTDYWSGLLAKLPGHIGAKRNIAATGALKPTGVYALPSFDEYGDIVYERTSNIMDGMVSEANLPEISAKIVTDSFADMINKYASTAQKRGASVYFGFCPVNEKAVEIAQGIDTEGFLNALDAKLDIPVIASLEDHIMDAGYFYDSNFHMNDAGAIYNTILLVNDIKRVNGNMSQTETAIPKPPAGDSEGDILSSGEIDGLKYVITSKGAAITGLTSEGLTKSEITVPDMIENASVYKIESRAFANASASKIILPATVSVLGVQLFDGASNLNSVYLNAYELPEVGDGLIDGAPAELKIYVPGESYGLYITDYFWTRYTSVLARGD